MSEEEDIAAEVEDDAVIAYLEGLHARLRQKLKRAARCHEEVDETKGQIAAMLAVHEFLEGLGIEQGLLRPLQIVTGALVDSITKEGAQKPVLESAFLGKAAALIEILLDSGLSVEAATREVARVIGGRRTPKQLEEFRKNVRKGRASDEAIFSYRRMVERDKSILKGLSPEQAVAAVRFFAGNYMVVPAKKGY